MRKKVLIATTVILIIIIAVVCVFYFKSDNTTVGTGSNLIDTMANIESLANSFLETSNELDNTLVKIQKIKTQMIHKRIVQQIKATIILKKK